MSTQLQRNRGRPRGSTKSVHRVRRDYRFSLETLERIARGRALKSEALDETAFVEQAIVHYAAHLEGSVQNQIQVSQEVVLLQAQVADLERNLAHTQQALRQAEAKTRREAAPVHPNPSARPGPRKPLYQILIKHASGPCPSLPDGYGFLYTQEKEYHCPVHLVFAAPCAIDQARRRIEVLKRVPGLLQIWLTKDGYSTPQDNWSKGTSVWLRTDG